MTQGPGNFPNVLQPCPKAPESNCSSSLKASWAGSVGKAEHVTSSALLVFHNLTGVTQGFYYPLGRRDVAATVNALHHQGFPYLLSCSEPANGFVLTPKVRQCDP